MKRELSTDEYAALRAELLADQDRKANVWLHMYILFLTLFALGFSVNRELFLLTYIILIPYQEKMNNLEWNVSRISTYIKVFYESENPLTRWEHMNTEYKPYLTFFSKKIKGIASVVRNDGSSHLGVLATGFYLYSLIQENISNNKMFFDSISDWILAVLSIVLLVIVVCQNKLKKTKCEKELKEIMIAFKNDCYEKAGATPEVSDI